MISPETGANRRQVIVPDLYHPRPTFSHAISVGETSGFVFISGLTARDSDGTIVGVGDIAAQTKQVCEGLRMVLRATGAELSDVVRIDVYLREIEHLHTVHQIRESFFPPPAPASTTVEVSRLACDDCLVEMNAIAVKPDHDQGQV